MLTGHSLNGMSGLSFDRPRLDAFFGDRGAAVDDDDDDDDGDDDDDDDDDAGYSVGEDEVIIDDNKVVLDSDRVHDEAICIASLSLSSSWLQAMA
jgi:hypothetical protein